MMAPANEKRLTADLPSPSTSGASSSGTGDSSEILSNPDDVRFFAAARKSSSNANVPMIAIRRPS
jgi:hypothetical protein